MLLITDGQSNYNYWDTLPAADELKQAGIKIMVLGVAITDNTEIKAIASSPEDVHEVKHPSLCTIFFIKLFVDKLLEE